MNNRSKNSDPKHALYRAILALQTPEECYAFFHDLCTQTELRAIEQRFDVARMLYDGMIYNDILAQTGASSATVSRVNRSLMNGKDAYSMIFDRIKESE
ncbi:MAG: TrpR-like protein [Ruminococcaceae bacterium]|nr:TrpR-like protein [Oscillospiraceae bacterium]